MIDQFYPLAFGFAVISIFICPFISLIGGHEKGVGCACSILSAIALVIVAFAGGLIYEIFGRPSVIEIAIIVAFGIIGILQWGLAIENCKTQIEEKHGFVCPKCKVRGARIQSTRGPDYLTTEKQTKTITHYDSDGEVSGHSEYEYETPAIDYDVSLYKKCGGCGHIWQ